MGVLRQKTAAQRVQGICMLFADTEPDDSGSESEGAEGSEGGGDANTDGRADAAEVGFCTLVTCLHNSRSSHMMTRDDDDDDAAADGAELDDSDDEIDPPELVPIASGDAAGSGSDESDGESDGEGGGDDSEAEARSVEADHDEELSADLLARVRAAAEGLAGSDSDVGDGLDSDDEDGCALRRFSTAVEGFGALARRQGPCRAR